MSRKRAQWPLAIGLAGLSLCCFLLSVSSVRADEAASLPAPGAAAASSELAFIEQSFLQQRLGAALWYSGWTALNTSNAAVGWWQYAVGEKRVEKDAWLVSALGSSFCVLQSLVFPLPGMYGAHRLRRWENDSSLTLEARHRRALALLEKAADFETVNSGLLAHIVGLGYAVASSGYIYFRNMHAEPKALATAVSLQFVTTVIVVEGTIWSVPRRARRDLAELRARRAHAELSPIPLRAPLATRPLELRLALRGTQLGAALSF